MITTKALKMTCKICGSRAINHSQHGRDGTDQDLCDVCYWRGRNDDRVEEIVRLRAEIGGLRNRIKALESCVDAAERLEKVAPALFGQPIEC